MPGHGDGGGDGSGRRNVAAERRCCGGRRSGPPPRLFPMTFPPFFPCLKFPSNVWERHAWPACPGQKTARPIFPFPLFSHSSAVVASFHCSCRWPWHMTTPGNRVPTEISKQYLFKRQAKEEPAYRTIVITAGTTKDNKPTKTTGKNNHLGDAVSPVPRLLRPYNLPTCAPCATPTPGSPRFPCF